jgi:hypothetical protein
MAKKTKTQFEQFEAEQTVYLTRAILRYSDARAGIEFNPPQVLFPVGAKATVLERKANSDMYVIVLADSSFVISRHAESLTAVPLDVAEIPLLPAGDAGLFPAAHPRPTVPAELADSYDSFAEFASEVEARWNLDECLAYPCAVTLQHAVSLMRGMARNDGYDALLPAYEKFIAVCDDDALLQDADMLLRDYTPRVERDSRWYGLVRK